MQREAGPVLVFCLALTLVLVMLPHQLLLDGWLTLLSGREVVTEGLPGVDTLTVMTAGTEWTNQQWLGQAIFYVLEDLGGIRLVMLVHVAVVAAALGIALVAARRLGGTPRNVAVVAAAALLVAPWAIQLRTQSLALPLFALLLGLLAADSRAPSRRVLLVFPLLVLWSNVHGTVVLAALFVALRGLTSLGDLRRGRDLRGPVGRSLLLTLAPFACIFASPYAFDLGAYYRSLLLNPGLRSIAPEWEPSTPSFLTIGFYVVGAASLWLLARRRSRLTSFEQAALLATIVLGATALRSVIWFAIAAVILVPQLLDSKAVHVPGPRLRLALAAAAACLVASVGSAVARPASWYTSSWPEQAAERIGALAAADPDVKIFSDGRFGSWLLWSSPELRGRVSHDVRWELYTDAELQTLIAFDRRTEGWRRVVRGYQILVLDRQTHPAHIEALRGEPGTTVEWKDQRVVVLHRR